MNSSSNGRSLSRQILGSDLDLVNKYASKYAPSASKQSSKRSLGSTASYTAVPNPAYGAKQHGYGASMGYNNYSGYNNNTSHHPSASYQHGYGSNSSNSSSGSLYASKHSAPSKSVPKSRRQPSNLMTAASASQWNASTMDHQTQDMSAAMSSMVSSFQSRVADDADFLDEIQHEASQSPEFAKAERAEEWSVKEVCFWLSKIHLDKYIKPFRDQIIDGSILLRDLDDAMLVNELGVKRLHVKKLQREIGKLAGKSAKMKKESNDQRDELIETLREEVVELERKNKRLLRELHTVKQKYGHTTSNSFNSLYPPDYKATATQ